MAFTSATNNMLVNYKMRKIKIDCFVHNSREIHFVLNKKVTRKL